jgi:hypothetical protein
MHYYENPEPKRIPEAVKYMSQSGVLDIENAFSPTFGFLSGVFRRNPERVTPWLRDIGTLSDKHFSVVVFGLWYADLPDSKARVVAVLAKHPKLKSEFAFINQGAPMTIEQIPLEQGPWVLDALWGKFMATGESAPVERIISTLPWIDVKGDLNRLMVGGAARWSLTSNAIEHTRVLEICENSLKTQEESVAERLVKVIDAATKERQQRHNPAVEGTLRDEAAQRPSP